MNRSADTPKAPLISRIIWRLGPAHWIFHACVLTAALVQLAMPWLMEKAPLDVLYYAALLICGLWVFAFASWCLNSLLVCIGRSKPNGTSAWRIILWCIAPLVGIAMLFNGWGDWCSGEIIQFCLARPAMERRIAEIAALPRTPGAAGTGIETFDYGGTQRLPSGLYRFRHPIGHPFDWNGFAYSATLPPSKPDDGFVYLHIRGPWYRCYGP